MKGQIQKIIIDERELFIYLPDGYDTSDRLYPVIYVQDGDTFQTIFTQIIDYLESEVENGSLGKHIIVGITPFDRLDEYTPWPAKANHKKFHDFGGQGDKYLNYLKFELSYYMEHNFRVSKDKKDRKIMGHSLGALISLYSVFTNNDYSKIVGICASQWYTNWVTFIENEEIINEDFQILMIAGRKEGLGKTTIQKDAPKCSEIFYEKFKKRIGEGNIEIIWDDFDHHENLINRYKIAFQFLMK